MHGYVRMCENGKKLKRMKKISIIVPVHNGRKYIEDCLLSIANQTYRNLELRIYDDGSTDESYMVIQNFWNNFKEKAGLEVHVVRQENQGVANTRNRGIDEATGDFILFVDQDDRLAPDYCEKYIHLAEEKHADIVVGGYTRMSTDGKVQKKVNLPNGEWAKFIVMAPWAHIYRTSFLRENGICFLDYGIGEDVYFNMMACSNTDRIVITDYNGYVWMNNPKSVSNSKQNSICRNVDPIYLLDAIYTNLPEHNYVKPEMVEYFFVRYLIWYFFFTVRNSSRQDVAAQYDRTMAWLKDKFPLFYKNHYLNVWNRKGELMSIAAAFDIWKVLYRVGLLKHCLLLLARGK